MGDSQNGVGDTVLILKQLKVLSQPRDAGRVWKMNGSPNEILIYNIQKKIQGRYMAYSVIDILKKSTATRQDHNDTIA